MDRSRSRPQHTFVIRLWSEVDHPNASQWRGTVEHLPSGRRACFTSLIDLSDLILLTLSRPGVPAGSDPSSKARREP